MPRHQKSVTRQFRLQITPKFSTNHSKVLACK